MANKLSKSSEQDDEIESEYDIGETDSEAVSHAVINQAVNACHLDRYMRLDCIGLCIYNVPQVLELEGGMLAMQDCWRIRPFSGAHGECEGIFE